MRDHDKVQQLVQIKTQAPMTFVPDTSALIVVDVQRYFARPDYPFAQVLNRLIPGFTAGYFDRVHSHVLNNIARLQAGFRAQGRPVIFLAAGCLLPRRPRPAGVDARFRRAWRAASRPARLSTGRRSGLAD